MILSRSKIMSALDDKDIRIDPRPADHMIGPNSVDIRLGQKMLKCDAKLMSNPIDSREPQSMQADDFEIGFKEMAPNPDGGFVLSPNQFYLASTYEFIGSDVYHMQIHGRSSAARLGLSIHETAGYGDVGFYGRWTLEIAPKLPIIIYPYQVIAQVSFQCVQTEPRTSHKDVLYKDKSKAIYHNQAMPALSKGLGYPVKPKDII